ncbi:MAG: ATP synthase F1 subunit delta [Spirochaetales bacterium]
MSAPQAALHYARALYEVADEAGTLDATTADVERVVRLLESVPGLRDYCETHCSDRSTDGLLVDSAFAPGVSPTTARWLGLLAQNDRLPALLWLKSAWQRLLDARAEVLPVLVETATPWADEELAQLRVHLGARLKKDVRLEVRQNEGLRGGLRLFWGDKLLDASLSGRLRGLRTHVTGAAHE